MVGPTHMCHTQYDKKKMLRVMIKTIKNKK
jgi:hypothetical protein